MSAGLEEQKGWDLIVGAEPELLRLDARFVFMGEGQPRYREALRRMATEHPGRIHFHEGRDRSFAHRLMAGCDLFLAPARSEPCGELQMASQRYGAAPLVHAVGGLADSVEPFDPLSGRGTGFSSNASRRGHDRLPASRALALAPARAVAKAPAQRGRA